MTKIKVYPKCECESIARKEYDKINSKPVNLSFGLPDEVFGKFHDVVPERRKKVLESDYFAYSTKSGWAVPNFFVEEVIEE